MSRLQRRIVELRASRRRWRAAVLLAFAAGLAVPVGAAVHELVLSGGDEATVRCDGRRLETVARDRVSGRWACHPRRGDPPPSTTTVPPTTTTTLPPTTTTTRPPGGGPDPWPQPYRYPPLDHPRLPVRPWETGYRVPTSSLRVVGTGDVTRCVFASELGVGAGGTISGWRIRGTLALDAPNIRVVDNWIEGGVRVFFGCGIGDRGRGAVVEHNLIGHPDVVQTDRNAIGDSNYTARYNRILGFEDGCRCNGNVVFERNWVTLVTDHDAHNDGVQLTDNGSPALGWGGPTTIRFNVLLVPWTQNSAIQAKGDTGPVDHRLTIEGNWLDGGGYALAGGGSVTDAHVINNVWGRTYFRCSGAYGPFWFLQSGIRTWSGNVWDDGRELRPGAVAC